MSNIQDFILNIRQKLFIKSLITDLKSDIYVVGGATRDLILNKPNKDIDLIVRNVPIDILIAHLQKFGRVDAVGKSFGVLKFIDSDGLDYDIALPRKEMPNGEGGYRGFDVQSDENLPIEDDLIRRDAKLNAMAISINSGKFIDPLGGLDDIKNKLISAANPDAFSDDPLRMIRMVAFASRFGFTIEPETMQMIIDNAHRVKEIAPERILTEFDKIIKKGNKLTGVELLANTGLFKQIFGNEIKPSMLGRRDFDGVRTMGEFIFLMTYGVVQHPAAFFKEKLKGDIDSFKEIKALEQAFDNASAENSIVARTIAHNMFVISPPSLQSQILPTAIETAAQELLQGKYPKTVNELALNGNDLMQLGLKGKEIGDAQKMMLLKIYSDIVENNKEDLLSLLGKNDVNEYGFSEPKNSWEADGQEVNVDFFIEKYDQWNQGERFRDPSKESVLRFFEDEFVELVGDEKLRQELLWALTDRDVLNENVEMNNIAYTGIVLDETSKQKLIKVFSKMIPEGWEVIAHHMTLNLGAIDSKYVQDLDKEIELTVVDYAIDDKVMAVGVDGYPTNNKKAHITLAVNRQGGGKPMMSNSLTEWRPIEFPLVLKGIVTQVRK